MKDAAESPRPPRERTERAAPDVRAAVNRCPYCHDDVAPDESVACRTCLARHHGVCWDEAASCAACGSAAALMAPQPRADDPTVDVVPRGTLGLGLMGMGALIGFPLALWLKLAHGIDRVGPVPALALGLVPFLLGAWVNVALGWRRSSPAWRRISVVGLLISTGCLLVALTIFALA